MNTDPLALDNQVCFALYAANRAMTSLYRPLLDALGLTYPQYLVMLVLWEAQGQSAEGAPTVTVSSIGERLRLDSGTLTPLLKRLEHRGLVTRRRRETDERVVDVALTPDGQQLRTQALTVPGDMLCRSGLDVEQANQLRRNLRLLLDQFS